MDDNLRALLDRLHTEGLAHDAEQADRLLRRRNLEPASADLLAMTVRLVGARFVVEIGTSNGYSTLWLADAVGDTAGRVLSVDLEPLDEARDNLERAGLADRVELRRADGGEVLSELGDGSVDLLFLDAERTGYAAWWPQPARVLRTGGVQVVDNVLSHPDEVEGYLGLVEADTNLVSTTVPVGKGLHLAWRR